VELESIAAGVLLELLFPGDTEVPVGAVIARVGAPEETRTPVAPAGAVTNVDISPVARRLADEHLIDVSSVPGSGMGGKIMRRDVEAIVQPIRTSELNGGVLALPKVRKAARALGIDLTHVPATGARGQVTLRDLEGYQSIAAAAVSTASPVFEEAVVEAPVSHAGVREVPLSRARKVIGERLGKSKRDAPHFYVSGEFDIEAAVQQLPAQVRINDLIQYLTVQALMSVPELNATYEQDRIYIYDHVNLGIAVALEDGLITPVLHHAERYSLQGIAAEWRELVQRAREKRLKTDDLQGSTFTISNLGVVKQVERFTAVINPPQVAVLAVGSAKPRPVILNGGLHIHHTVYLTLSGDHRAVDGMHLARFMTSFQEALERFTKRAP
jgi:pyruvate dehydrogenase E2 component (dihydrolipoamide acetyltransferase)